MTETRESIAEIITGTLVLIMAGLFLAFATDNGRDSNSGSDSSYELIARFNRADGLIQGSDIRISGIKIGVVSKVDLDPESYMAQLTLSVKDSVKLPVDSIAKVSSDGLLGGSHISLEPGIEEDRLDDGEEIEFTRGSIDILTLISGFISGMGGKN